MKLVVLLATCAWAGSLEDWKKEIEQTSGARIALLHVFADPATGEVKAPPLDGVVRRALENESFRRELFRAHALTIHDDGEPGPRHFILVNMSLADQFKGVEDGLVAHELGHIWLHRRGLRSPAFEPGPEACLAIHSGDIVQHALIHPELARRGFSLDYFRRNLTAFFDAPADSSGDPCQALVAVSYLADAAHIALSHPPQSPQATESAAAIVARLRDTPDLSDAEQFSAAVDFVRQQLERLYATIRKSPNK
ncbi:MAG: hypothetical protein ACRD96_27190 [Bryobacteraceae bacterium]